VPDVDPQPSAVPRYAPTKASEMRRIEGFGAGRWLVIPYLGGLGGLCRNDLPLLVLLVGMSALLIAAIIVARRHRVARWAEQRRRRDTDIACLGSALVDGAVPAFVRFSDPYPGKQIRDGLVVLSDDAIRLFERPESSEPLELELAGLTAQVLAPKRRGKVAVVFSNAAKDVSWWWLRRVDSERVREALHRARIRPHVSA
jgi:hypothetical protein